MKKRERTWQEAEVVHFRDHAEEIPLYIQVALDEAQKSGMWRAFVGSLRIVAEACGNPALAKDLADDPGERYKSLCADPGFTRLEVIETILREVGLQLTVQPIVAPPRAGAASAGSSG